MRIAIECANEREQMALIKHMNSKGWKSATGCKATDEIFSSFFPCINYSDNFHFTDSKTLESFGFHVIPFPVFAELMKIELPRYTYDANTLDVSGVDSLTYDQVCEVAKLMGEMRNA